MAQKGPDDGSCSQAARPVIAFEGQQAGDAPVKRPFRGESIHKVDQKGRVSVPASFRRTLEEGDPDWQSGGAPNLVLIYGMPKSECLEGYTVAGVALLDEKVARLPTFSKTRRYLERVLNTQSLYAQVDENGRIVLPQRLREKFELQTEAMFAGMGERFQIWAPAAYEADMASLEEWHDGLGDEEDAFAELDALDHGGIA